MYNIKQKLTKAESKVFDLLIEPLDLLEIANKLNITKSTVNKHIKNILIKSNKPSRIKLVTSYYKDLIYGTV